MYNSDQVNVICPKCENEEQHEYFGGRKKIVTCSNCSTAFIFLVARIRAKRSRGNKRNNTREFDIRIILNGGSEEFIQFTNSRYEDIELRSKDLVVFSYLGDKLRVIQNVSILRYTKISEPRCFIATFVYGQNSNEIIILRKWRDKVLLTSKTGRKLVNFYYRTSPRIVIYSMRSKTVRVAMTVSVHLLWKVIAYWLQTNRV